MSGSVCRLISSGVKAQRQDQGSSNLRQGHARTDIGLAACAGGQRRPARKTLGSHPRVGQDPVSDGQTDGVQPGRGHHSEVRLGNPDVPVVLDGRPDHVRQAQERRFLRGTGFKGWGSMLGLGWVEGRSSAMQSHGEDGDVAWQCVSVPVMGV